MTIDYKKLSRLIRKMMDYYAIPGMAIGVIDRGEVHLESFGVRDAEGQQRVVAETIEQFGRLDIVVANAGVLNWGRLWEISPQQWQDTLDINLTGMWNTIRAVVPAMIAAGNGGSIIATSSAAGIKAVPGCGHYCASKFGVVGMINALAVELGEFGIRVNSVHPYGTDTPMGNDVSMYEMFAAHPNFIHSYSPGALPTDSLAAPNLISDVVVFIWRVFFRR